MSRKAFANPFKLPFTLLNAFSQIMQEQLNNPNRD